MVQIGPGSVTCWQHSLALSFAPDQGPSVFSLSQYFILLLSYHFIYIIYPQRSKFVIISSLYCIFFSFFSHLISFCILLMFIPFSLNFYLLCLSHLFSFLLIQPAHVINFPLNTEFALIPQTLNTYLSCNYWPNNIYIRLQETHTSGNNHGIRVGPGCSLLYPAPTAKATLSCQEGWI